MYDELLKQPLPEKLTAPLRALDKVQSPREGLNDAIEAMQRSGTTERATLPNRKSA
jgi:hypothetical protein